MPNEELGNRILHSMGEGSPHADVLYAARDSKVVITRVQFLF